LSILDVSNSRQEPEAITATVLMGITKLKYIFGLFRNYFKSLNFQGKIGLHVFAFAQQISVVDAPMFVNLFVRWRHWLWAIASKPAVSDL